MSIFPRIKSMMMISDPFLLLHGKPMVTNLTVVTRVSTSRKVQRMHMGLRVNGEPAHSGFQSLVRHMMSNVFEGLLLVFYF